VVFHRGFADLEKLGDFLVGVGRCNRTDDLAFAVGEPEGALSGTDAKSVECLRKIGDRFAIDPVPSSDNRANGSK